MNNETLKILFDNKVIDARQVILAACVNVGFTPEEAESVIKSMKTRVSNNHRWTVNEKFSLKEMYEAGTSINDIAQALNLQPKQIKGMTAAMRLRRKNTV